MNDQLGCAIWFAVFVVVLMVVGLIVYVSVA